ncbi:glycosyl hydrolase [Pochonia chlamydosporia 170]|uniref:Glycosyl hydrolase n=1 Tax=Pochonia chlamydosporia 170 TaxID=1380566 RepID=A0A179F0F9_METCM|nr:glycosyl hydrolase [Pochonia chlamydosporia 170]OAQ58926.1 glycosyl hydrolase [Pochonia chlamydosporia 170]
MKATFRIIFLATSCFATNLASRDDTPLVSSVGQAVAIPSWDLQSSSVVGNDLQALSNTGVDTSSWYHVQQSRCTLMGCLLGAGEYEESDLWFSDNLNHVDNSRFNVPWVYRSTFSLPVGSRHYILETNGITSKADIFLNGRQIADAESQAGAYAGHTYDVTGQVSASNALVVKVHPTDYHRDLAVGFADWNPSPPDNGTGLWRDITIKQTGPISIGPLNAVIDIDLPVERNAATVTLRAKVQNLERTSIEFIAEATIWDSAGQQVVALNQSATLGPRESGTVAFNHTIPSPEIWWPRQWGAQPLYTAKVILRANATLSDIAHAKFGVRTVTSELNKFKDRQFKVNGYPFQVIGSGYSPDMFLRWDPSKFGAIARYMLDMGLNTIRLEGKMEQPDLYEVTDALGLMVMAGWECCNKWEAWEYNDDIKAPELWGEHDYAVANESIKHEAAVLQPHPSVLAFMVGSDYGPDKKATTIYMAALKDVGWQTPIISSISGDGNHEPLEDAGIRMEGPYNWSPPTYWYDKEHRRGSAFGFVAEQGSGVGTPEMGSLRKFLNKTDLDDLWMEPGKQLFHLPRGEFQSRKDYNKALFERYGAPKSLDDYLIKAQLMDYEAARVQYEAFSTRLTATRPATGTIYWMLNNVWPGMNWHQFDYYLHPAGAYFGTKVGSRIEHVAYDYVDKSVWLINRSLNHLGSRRVDIEVMDLTGNLVFNTSAIVETTANNASKVAEVKGLDKVNGTVLLRILLSDPEKGVSSRNIYWVANSDDVPDWGKMAVEYTGMTSYADYTSLGKMQRAELSVNASKSAASNSHTVLLENLSQIPAFFISLSLIDSDGQDTNPVLWSDNYVTLWPNEKLELQVTQPDGKGVGLQIRGWNVDATMINL